MDVIQTAFWTFLLIEDVLCAKIAQMKNNILILKVYRRFVPQKLQDKEGSPQVEGAESLVL